MTTTTAPELTDEFISHLAQRAAAAEELRRLPAETVADFRASGLAGLLLPARYGGRQAEFPEILDPIRRMAHGCASSAWTLGFYMLHNWMLALFGEQAQDEVFAGGPVLCPAPLAPTGRGVPDGDGIRLSGRWSWATGVMECDWIMVGAICGPDDAPYPALVLLPADEIRVEDVWHTAGMRATGSNDVLIDDVFVPSHRLVKVVDIYSGTAPGADLHDGSAYRWPMVPALALVAAMPALGSAEWVTDLFAERLTQRVLAYSGAAQKNQPAAQIRLGDALSLIH
ncbi:acyl-CoA dehydrogenase family protein, partial [Mycobacterium sp. UM_Kg1]|uniref:acyl-CoA dehydrogenase family protein n=1 Tax=Mycobacterium sp. UM_Kg1 TaxID=1545691 RepID=UPI00061B20CB